MSIGEATKPKKSDQTAASLELFPLRLLFKPGFDPKRLSCATTPISEGDKERLVQSEMLYGIIEPDILDVYTTLPLKRQKHGVFELRSQLLLANDADILDEITRSVAVGLKLPVKQVFTGQAITQEFRWPHESPRFLFTISFWPVAPARPLPTESVVAAAGEIPYTGPVGITEKGQDVPSPRTDEAGLHREFDELVGSIATEREGQAARVQQVLNEYLRRWDEEQQRLTREQKGRLAEEIAKAKQELVERVNTALERLDLSIYRGGLPCKLMLVVGESNRRGQFWLMPQGSKKPLAQKANLSDLLNLSEGEPEIRVAPQRREALVEWRAKVHANQHTKRSK